MSEDKRRREAPDVRGEEIIKAALELSQERGYRLITRQQIADRAGCSPSLVGKYYGDMFDMRGHIMQAAIDYKNAEVVLQGLVARHPLAMAAPEALKKEAGAILFDSCTATLEDLEA